MRTFKTSLALIAVLSSSLFVIGFIAYTATMFSGFGRAVDQGDS